MLFSATWGALNNIGGPRLADAVLGPTVQVSAWRWTTSAGRASPMLFSATRGALNNISGPRFADVLQRHPDPRTHGPECRFPGHFLSKISVAICNNSCFFFFYILQGDPTEGDFLQFAVGSVDPTVGSARPPDYRPTDYRPPNYHL